jgi:hypothetical protein
VFWGPQMYSFLKYGFVRLGDVLPTQGGRCWKEGIERYSVFHQFLRVG